MNGLGSGNTPGSQGDTHRSDRKILLQVNQMLMFLNSGRNWIIQVHINRSLLEQNAKASGFDMTVLTKG